MQEVVEVIFSNLRDLAEMKIYPARIFRHKQKVWLQTKIKCQLCRENWLKVKIDKASLLIQLMHKKQLMSKNNILSNYTQKPRVLINHKVVLIQVKKPLIWDWVTKLKLEVRHGSNLKCLQWNQTINNNLGIKNWLQMRKLLLLNLYRLRLDKVICESYVYVGRVVFHSQEQTSIGLQ